MGIEYNTKKKTIIFNRIKLNQNNITNKYGIRSKGKSKGEACEVNRPEIFIYS